MRALHLLLLLAAGCEISAQTMRIAAIDVEGGKATLYVSPSGESMLIDTGYAGNDGRDAKRIAAAATRAGVKRIDNLVITHYHGDHAGGVRQLAATMPVGKIFHRGDDIDRTNRKTVTVFEAFSEVRSKYPHQAVHPGDTIPMKGMRVDVVAAGGESLARPLAGAGEPNPLCATYEAIRPDPGENARSVGVVITLGKLRVADLGDLHWNKEHELVCPVNQLGTVGLYMTTHHGTETSGPAAIVHAMRPLAAVMNNGANKGGSKKAWTTIRESPGLEDIWQLHTSEAGGSGHNAPEAFIANPSVADDAGYAIEVTGRADGSFTIRNLRNGYEKSYRR